MWLDIYTVLLSTGRVLLSSGPKLYSAPPAGSKVCSLPPALGAWRIDGTGERSSGFLSHQVARPLRCDSTSSGCSARNCRMNLVMSDSYMSAFSQWNPLAVLGAGVARGRPDDLAVGALLDHVRRPAAGARDHEDRREHGHGHAHHVIRHGAVPVEVGEHLLLAPHDHLDALGDVEELHRSGALREAPRDLLDDLVARIAGRVYRVAEADDDLLRLDAAQDIGLCCIRALISGQNLER